MSNFEIVAREDFSDVTYLLEVRHPLMAKAARPGQFVIVMSHPHGERIPLTLADYDRDKGTITLVIQAVGKTTREMQRDCVVGTSLYGVTGPMATNSSMSAWSRRAFLMPAVTLPLIPADPSSVQTMNWLHTSRNLSSQNISSRLRKPMMPMT